MQTYNRVTTILREEGLSQAYSNVPESVLEFARKRGEYVQKMIDLYEQESLDFNTIDERLKHYLDQWIAFKKEYNAKILSVRQAVKNEEYGYIGELDYIVHLRNIKDTVVMDLKCTADVYDSALYQVSAYNFADEIETSSDPIILWFPPKKKFEVVEAKQNHLDVFLAAALLNKIKREKK